MKPACQSQKPVLPLPRAATWEQWESGRSARRELSRQLSGGKILRRKEGDPRKDRFLRTLNKGERGLPFRVER